VTKKIKYRTNKLFGVKEKRAARNNNAKSKQRMAQQNALDIA